MEGMDVIERYQYAKYRKKFLRRHNLTARVWVSALAVLAVFALFVLVR